MRLVAHRLPTSAAAAQALADAGANMFELDLQLWRERLVVSHYLAVMWPIPRWRRDGLRFSWARELRGEPFGVAVQTVPDGAGLVLDLKNDSGREAWLLAERVVTQDTDRARCVVASKHWASLDYLADRGFATWRSVATRRRLARLLAAGPDPRHAGVSVRHTFLTPATLERLRPFGEVIAWTVPTPSRARQLTRMGVGGIVADMPEVLAAAAGDDA